MSKQAKKVVSKKTKTSGFFPQIRSRHPSHDDLRDALPKNPFRSVIRLGSDWEGDGKSRIQINTVGAVACSSDKLLMKRAFAEAEVITAEWRGGENITYDQIVDLEFPIVAKGRWSSRGEGNTLLRLPDEFRIWARGKNLSNYIFEHFYNYSREYRLHVTTFGCFYTCRKMLRNDTPVENRWYRNDSNSTWIVEENEMFDKPTNWNDIVAESVKAIRAVGLDIGAVDVRVQSANNGRNNRIRTAPRFIILETNSAPSFGERTLDEYKKILPKLLKDKYING